MPRSTPPAPPTDFTWPDPDVVEEYLEIGRRCGLCSLTIGPLVAEFVPSVTPPVVVPMISEPTTSAASGTSPIQRNPTLWRGGVAPSFRPVPKVDGATS